MRIRGMLALATAALSGCAFSPSLGPNEDVGPASHHVRYSVMCEACLVTYTTGLNFESEEIKGSWSKTVGISGSVTRVVSLTATPARAGILVQNARIEVDGRRVAEERRKQLEAFGDQVTLTATLGVRGFGDRPPAR